MPEPEQIIQRWSIALAIALLAAATFGWVLRTALPLPVVAAAWALAFWVAVPTRSQQFTAANLATLARSLVLVGCVAFDDFHGALTAAGAVLSLILDGVDGWLARRFRNETPFGAQLDVDTDGALVATLALVNALEGHGLWSLLAGALRPLAVLGRALMPKVVLPEPRSGRGRYTFLVSTSLWVAALWLDDALWSSLATATACALLCVSFVPDFQGIWRARTHISPL